MKPCQVHKGLPLNIETEWGKRNKGEGARDRGSNRCQRQVGKGGTGALLSKSKPFEFSVGLRQIQLP